MTELPCQRQACTTLSKEAVRAHRPLESEPYIFRLFTTKRSDRSAKSSSTLSSCPGTSDFLGNYLLDVEVKLHVFKKIFTNLLSAIS